MKTYVPLWMKVPRSVRKKYEDGATVLDLSIKYKINPSAIRKALLCFGTKMRSPGTVIQGKRRWYKLSKKDIDTILQLDDKMVSHSDIGRQFNVSRERIRQICLESGHKTRRSRIVPKWIVLHEQRLARKAKRNEMVQAVSEAWRSGMTIQDLGLFMKSVGFFSQIEGKVRNIYIVSKISQLRYQHGKELFPFRRPSHWTQQTPKQRAERIKKMVKEWNIDPNIYRMMELFGYKSYASTCNAITQYNRRYPGLFKSKRQILDEAVRN